MTEAGVASLLRLSFPGDRPAIRAIAGEAHARLAEALAALSGDDRTRLQQIPLERAIEIVDSYPRQRLTQVLAKGVPQLERELLSAGGEEWSVAFRRLLLLGLLVGLPERKPMWRIPEVVWRTAEDGFRALLEDLSVSPPARWNDGDFKKDLAAAQLRAIPVNGRICEVAIRQVRNDARDATLAERLRLVAYLRTRYWRRAWWLTSHSWRGFRPARQEAWGVFEINVAALAAVNPEVVGRVGGGWLYDPHLASITPRLSERSTGMVSIGARRFRGVESAETTRLALATSGARRKLYEEGLYRPRNWWVAIRRDDLMRWAEAEWKQEERGHA